MIALKAVYGLIEIDCYVIYEVHNYLLIINKYVITLNVHVVKTHQLYPNIINLCWDKVMKNEIGEIMRNKKGNITYVKGYIEPYVGKLAIVICLTFFGISISLVQPLIFGKSIDCIEQKNFSLLIIFGIFSLLLECINGITEWIGGSVFARIGMSIVYDIKKDFFSDMLELPIKKFEQLKSGEFITRYETDITNFAEVLTKTVVDSIMNFISAIIILLFLLYLNIKITLVLLILFPILLFIEKLFAKEIQKQMIKIRDENDNYLSYFTQIIIGIKEIKSMVIEECCKKNMNNMQSVFVKCVLKKNNISLISGYVKSVCWAILNLFILLAGYNSILANTFSLGGFVAYTTYSVRFYMALKDVMSIYTRYCEVSVSVDRVLELRNDLKSCYDMKESRAIKNISGNIEFKNVTFKYDDNCIVLNNLSLKLFSNCCNLIIGSSGIGKSTLLQLILKFYPVNQGQIFLGDELIEDIDTKFLRKNIAYVSQEEYFLSASIFENMQYVNNQLTEDELIQILKQVNLWHYINELPMGVHTQMSEAGKNFSEGQKQRLSLARAIAKKPTIYLMDEPTSALDKENKYELINIIKELLKTAMVVIVTHDQELCKELAEKSMIINMEEL